MRKFRFIGDPKRYQWKIKPIECEVYDWHRFKRSYGETASIEDFEFLNNNLDWKEVIEEPTKPLHKDTDLGYFSLEIMKSFISIAPHLKKDTSETANSYFVANCMGLAKELIKQLDAETKQT